MNIARKIAALGQNSQVVRALRPVRKWAQAAYGDTGLVHLDGHTGVVGPANEIPMRDEVFEKNQEQQNDMVCTVNGIPMRVLPNYGYGFPPEYDEPVARYFRQHLQPGDICLNVGANHGIYALQFAHWTGPNGRVFAYEANPDTARVLQDHVSLNGLSDRVRVVPRAVSDRVGTAVFHAAGTDGMSRLGEPNPQLAGKTTAITVELETLDAFCNRECIKPNAMMVDVEGFEIAVLTGAESLFANGRRFVAVIEIHPGDWGVAGGDRTAFEQLLARLEVRPVPLSGQSDPLGEYGHISLEPTYR